MTACPTRPPLRVPARASGPRNGPINQMVCTCLWICSCSNAACCNAGSCSLWNGRRLHQVRIISNLVADLGRRIADFRDPVPAGIDLCFRVDYAVEEIKRTLVLP